MTSTFRIITIATKIDFIFVRKTRSLPVRNTFKDGFTRGDLPAVDHAVRGVEHR